MKGIIGKKIGMTSIFDSSEQTACTIIEAGPCVVTQIKNQSTDGYNAVQIAFLAIKRKNMLQKHLSIILPKQTLFQKTIKEIRDFYAEQN